MNNEVMVKEDFSLAGLKNTSTTLADSNEITGVKPIRYFPFIQILQALSSDSERFGKGVMIVKKSGKDEHPVLLGDKFDAIPLAIRAKAAKFLEKGGVEAAYVTPRDEGPSDKYIEFRDQALKNPGFGSEYKSGLELLIWIPTYGFATYWANSVKMTATLEEQVAPYIGDPGKFGCRSEKNSKGTFYVPHFWTEEWEEQHPEPDDKQFNEVMMLFMYPAQNDSQGSEEDLEKVEEKRAR